MWPKGPPRARGPGDRPAGVTRLRVVALDLDHTPNLAAALDHQDVDVLYVSPLPRVDVQQVTSVTRPGRITSLTGVPRYVEDGVSVGLDVEGDRPQIVVNLAASRAEGADFAAQLLKLAHVLGMSEAAR